MPNIIPHRKLVWDMNTEFVNEQIKLLRWLSFKRVLLVEHVVIEFIAAVDLDSADLRLPFHLNKTENQVENN